MSIKIYALGTSIHVLVIIEHCTT